MLSERDLRILDEIESDLARDSRLVRVLTVERADTRWRLGCDVAVGISLVAGPLCLVLADNGTLGSAILAVLLAAAIVVVRHRRDPYAAWRCVRRLWTRPAMP